MLCNGVPWYVGPYHYSMVCLWVAGGGDGLQIWRVAANILNKVITADKGWSPSLGLGEGIATHKNRLL
jgi:hypothetical protein